MPANIRHKDVLNYARVPETVDAVTYERTFAPTGLATLQIDYFRYFSNRS